MSDIIPTKSHTVFCVPKSAKTFCRVPTVMPDIFPRKPPHRQTNEVTKFGRAYLENAKSQKHPPACSATG